MAGRALVLCLTLGLLAGALFAVCNTYPNSRVTEFASGETACAGTGNGCRECVTITDSGYSVCWANYGLYQLCSEGGSSGPMYN